LVIAIPGHSYADGARPAQQSLVRLVDPDGIDHSTATPMPYAPQKSIISYVSGDPPLRILASECRLLSEESVDTLSGFRECRG
jgi:hypothetical protein